ncbi:MAG TPA: DUF2281 domain-containing protein [Thermodesulfovibrionia bacterium]|nr:DUF2281 domain-containing protein [Thermodesulfovibrionia bacterium]
MNNEFILSRLNNLPEELKSEVLDFIEYLTVKYENKIQKQSQKIPLFGSCKGLFIIHDDFDEPLEDFKEYM